MHYKHRNNIKAQIYDQFFTGVAKVQDDMQQNNKQIIAKKAYRLVPDTVKMPPPELFTGKHDVETVR